MNEYAQHNINYRFDDVSVTNGIVMVTLLAGGKRGVLRIFNFALTSLNECLAEYARDLYNKLLQHYSEPTTKFIEEHTLEFNGMLANSNLSSSRRAIFLERWLQACFDVLRSEFIKVNATQFYGFWLEEDLPPGHVYIFKYLSDKLNANDRRTLADLRIEIEAGVEAATETTGEDSNEEDHGAENAGSSI